MSGHKQGKWMQDALATMHARKAVADDERIREAAPDLLEAAKEALGPPGLGWLRHDAETTHSDRKAKRCDDECQRIEDLLRAAITKAEPSV